MSNFTALNIVYEDESEEEIDDSKELQIEEALKLYQNALKLHSQGPAFYDEAEGAYRELLSSEIFGYAESLSETRWLDLYGDVDFVDDGDEEDAVADLPTAVASGEGAPSTLPQVLYLAYKNYGQFRLDRLREQLLQIERQVGSGESRGSMKNGSEAAITGLQHLAEALDRDESDLELWRKVARVGQFLGTHRISRFCLETVLNGEGPDPRTMAEPLSLEQAFANEQLLPLLASIGDAVAEDETHRLPQGRHNLMGSLRKYIDPYPYLPVAPPSHQANLASSKAADKEIKVLSRTWASCGAAILAQATAESIHSGEKGASDTDAGANYFITLPSKDTSEAEGPSSHVGLNDGTEDQLPPVFVNQIDARIAREGNTSNVDGSSEMLESLIKADNENNEQAIVSPKSTSPSSGMQIDSALPNTGSANQPDTERIENTNFESRETLNRKRSSETAELPDGADVGRSRSKRIKARGSITDPAALKDTTAEDWTTWYKQQLEIYVSADKKAFQAARKLLSKFGCNIVNDDFESEQIVASLEPEPARLETPTNSTHTAAQDLGKLLTDWDLAKSRSFLHNDGQHSSIGGIEGVSGTGFSAFLTQSVVINSNALNFPTLPNDIGLDGFVDEVRQLPWRSLGEVAFRWIKKLLEHQSLSSEKFSGPYEAFLWPEDLKKTVVLLLVEEDEFIFKEVGRCLEKLRQPAIAVVDPELQQMDMHQSEEKFVAFVQTIFELHVDIYSRITNPSSEVDVATRTLQHDRLSRWAALASTAINEASWSLADGDDVQQGSWQLMYRFLWASVISNNLLDPSSSEVTVAYFQYLIQQLKADSKESNRVPPVIHLPNNAIMPEISVDAAEREVSRLTTLEYFTSIFSSDDNDPISVIEKLEPLLLLTVNKQSFESKDGSQSSMESLNRDGQVDVPSATQNDSVLTDSRLLEALQFLRRASLSMRLILWQKLQDAYSIINYPPQILTCNLWSLIIIVRHLTSSLYLETAKESRQESLLKLLNRLDEFMTQILALASTDSLAFECVDQEQLLSSLEAVTSLQRIVHVFGSWEDAIRVGQTQPTPQLGNAASKAQLKSAEKFREMMVKTWTLQYILMKEAIIQIPDVQLSDEELLNYLKMAHTMLGLRTYCGLANKMFLKLAKTELLRMKSVFGWDSEMPQVVFDLYGLKISSTPADMQDHSCEPIELDRFTALEILDLLLLHVGRLSIKDLLKNDLRFAVDKMQGVIKVPKASHGSARNFNKRLLIAYLKSPISPLALYRSVRGIGELCSTSVHTEGYEVAAKGWYFLLGHIALTKFRSQKRITAGSMEDLENAKMFFRQDLEFDTKRWETWYRLAQTFDTQIDEYTTWTADKLENDKDGLIDIQRMAILCYVMAVAAAKRCESISSEDLNNMANLYTDFGVRLYASTREPFNAKVFALDEFKKQFNGTTRGMYEGLPFKPVPVYSVWKFASVLLRRAARQKPQDWCIPYMLGKVLWKMHKCSSDIHPPVSRLDSQLALDAILQAINCLPERRDGRHSDKDPILEPHYKLLSIVHKLVRSKRRESAIDVGRACHILKATPYARKVPDVQESEDWEQYILAVLKAMRSADKSNWHHRMVVKAAHIIYDENPNDMLAVLGAKHELSQQIFTKTMTIQVWKPDNERAGRHFVYTGRYVLFFADLLLKTNDRDNMDMLARRIRRKAGDFVNHTRIWQKYSMRYLELLRKSIPVPEQYEELIFSKMSPEEFSSGAARLEAWVLAPGTVCQHIDVLRDAMEFKKLNNNLMDKNIIENLIADVYAWIYSRNVDQLKAKEAAEENRIRMSVDTILMNPTPAPFTVNNFAAEPSGGEQQGRAVRRQFSVTRRMIIVKAEALIVKPPAIATPRPAPRTIAPAPLPSHSAALTVVIPQEGATAGEAISVPGSVHDSADDESELSDVEDLVDDAPLPQQMKKSPPKPFFPNLLGAKGVDEDADSTIGDDGANTTAKDEGEAAEEDVELESEAEKPQTQGHVPSGGFGSSRLQHDERGGEGMASQEREKVGVSEM